MEYVKLGNTGMDVSRLCIGCMSFGVAERWSHPWVLDEERSRPIIKKALELGINFFDTANMYAVGTSEEIVGRALKDYANRDELVLATKVRFPMRQGPNAAGENPQTEQQISLRSYVDQHVSRLIILENYKTQRKTHCARLRWVFLCVREWDKVLVIRQKLCPMTQKCLHNPILKGLSNQAFIFYVGKFVSLKNAQISLHCSTVTQNCHLNSKTQASSATWRHDL